MCGKKGSGDRSDVSLFVEWGLVGHRSFAGPCPESCRMDQDDNAGERNVGGKMGGR